jgi:hypothetical protein
VHNIYNSSDCPNNESQGEIKGELYESQGRLPGPSPLRSDGSLDSPGGRLECMSGGLRELKGGIRLESTQIRSFS